MTALLLVLLSASSLPAADFTTQGDEVIRLVEDHFYEPGRARSWARAHAKYGAGAHDAREFAKLTNTLLEQLNASHTHYYIPQDPGYNALLSIFQDSLKVGDVTYDSVGADIAALPEGYFARGVFAGGPAETAGLRRGDRVVSADGRPFDPYSSFLAKSGQTVVLEVERTKGKDLLAIPVAPHRVNPKAEWLGAEKAGARIFERAGKKIAYIDLWSCAGTEHLEAFQDAIAEKFQGADALVLDFRDGWGGCSPEFMNIFNPSVPVFTQIDHRKGTRNAIDTQWRKPLYVLINGGSRSGKEVVAFEIKKHKIGTLVGVKTAGAVLAGQPFLLTDKSLLYLAVLDMLVDGVRLEGLGVEPDVPALDSLPYAEGKDPQLEKALSLAAERS